MQKQGNRFYYSRAANGDLYLSQPADGDRTAPKSVFVSYDPAKKEGKDMLEKHYGIGRKESHSSLEEVIVENPQPRHVPGNPPKVCLPSRESCGFKALFGEQLYGKLPNEVIDYQCVRATIPHMLSVFASSGHCPTQVSITTFPPLMASSWDRQNTGKDIAMPAHIELRSTNPSVLVQQKGDVVLMTLSDHPMNSGLCLFD